MPFCASTPVRCYGLSSLVQGTKIMQQRLQSMPLEIVMWWVIPMGALTLGFNLGSSDIYLRKYNRSGVLQWTRQFGTTGYDIGVDVALDASNNVLVLSDDNYISTNGFVIRKFNSNGVLQTTKTVTSTTLTDLSPKALAIDSTEAVVVLAEWYSSTGTAVNIRIFKYTNALADVWNKPFQQTSNYEEAYDIATFGTDIYVTARINSSTSGLGARYGKLEQCRNCH